MRNGELLRRAEELFDVFVTADQNLRHQQNLSGRKLAILVLPSNQVPLVVRLVPVVETFLTNHSALFGRYPRFVEETRLVACVLPDSHVRMAIAKIPQ